jgi:DMSO/TMAO reductase YedYZ molybdopterin-dependent catalytic subunit
MPRSNSLVFIAIIVLVASAYGVNSYIRSRGAVQLDSVEIREYMGEKLGSIGSFRENSIGGPQDIDAEAYRLSVTGLVDNPGNYTYREVLEGFEASEKVVTLHCVEGWSVKILWEGVKVMDLLEEAGASETANTVIFHAHDGYTSSLPIDFIASNGIMMAYEMNGVTLPPERGFPFQLVAEDKWGYKWVKWITRIEVSEDEGYRGYWESRGYSNQADFGGGFFER